LEFVLNDRKESRRVDYLYSSARNYLGNEDVEIEVEVIDFGVEEGYVMI
jgi:hypothetical protein